MFAVDSKCFFVFPSFFCVFCFDMEKPPKNIVFYFFERIWSIKISFFGGFQHFRFGFLHWTVSKNKETMSSFVFWYLDWSYPFRKPNKPKVLFWVFHFKTKKQQTTEGTPKKTSFGSKPNILSFFWFLLEFFVFLFCLLFQMIAICVLMFAYLIGPGKSNFDQRFSHFLTQELVHYVRLSLA